MVRGQHYTGEVDQDGNCYGQVSATYDGYTGQMKDNKKHGYGIETHRYGFTFVGEFRNGKRCGKMTYHNPGHYHEAMEAHNQFYVDGVLKYDQVVTKKEDAWMKEKIKFY